MLLPNVASSCLTDLSDYSTKQTDLITQTYLSSLSTPAQVRQGEREKTTRQQLQIASQKVLGKSTQTLLLGIVFKYLCT